MKVLFEEASIEIIQLASEDVICTSGIDTESYGDGGILDFEEIEF